MSQKTRYLYNLSREKTPIHTESTRNRQARDNQDEGSLLKILHSFNLFCPESNDVLQNIATKDLTTEEIQDHLLHAQDRGQEQLTKFVTLIVLGASKLLLVIVFVILNLSTK